MWTYTTINTEATTKKSEATQTGSADVRVISTNLYSDSSDEKKTDIWHRCKQRHVISVFASVHTKLSTVMLVMTAHWKVPRMSIARATMMPISPGLSSAETHTLVSIKASVMSEHCCATLVALVAALLGSNRLWNYLVIGTQSTWRNHTCWLTLTLTLDSVNGKHARTHMLPLLSQWQIWSVCTDSVILISDSADCHTQIREVLMCLTYGNNHFWTNNTEFCTVRAHSPGVSPHLQSMSLDLYKPTFVFILKCQFRAKLRADFLLV